MPPATRQDAATADYHAWLVGDLDDTTFAAATEERMASLSERATLQAAEETILALRASQVLVELVDVMGDYRCARNASESAVGAERAAILGEAARLLSAAVAHG